MEPLFQTSLMGFSVTVYPDRVTYRKMWAGEQSVPLSQIASVTVAMMGVQRVTIETTGGKKIKMPVALSDKDKLRDAIFAAQSGTKPQHVAGPPQDETKAKKGAKAVSRVEGAQEEGKKGLRHVIAWVVGSIFVLMALASFGSSPAAALAFLVAAGVMLPPSSRYLQTKFSFLSRSGMRVAVAAIAFFVGVGISGSGGTQTPPSPRAAQGESSVVAQPKAREISYEIVERWTIPNGGEGKVIVIPSEYLNEADMMALGEKLKSDTVRDRNAFISVFTDKQAASLRKKVFAQEASQQQTDLYDKHYVAEYTRNINTGYHKLEIWYDGVMGSRNQAIEY